MLMIKPAWQFLIGRAISFWRDSEWRCHEVGLAQLLLSLSKGCLDTFRRRDDIAVVRPGPQ